MPHRPWLESLARYVGILPDYRDAQGKRHVTADRTRVALLHALELEASTERTAKETIESLRWEERARLLAPVRVVKTSHPDVQTISKRGLRLAQSVSWHIEIEEERGTRHSFEGRLSGRAGGDIRLPKKLGAGYHRLKLTLRYGLREQVAEQLLVVTPGTCPSVRKFVRGRQAAGLCVNLYSVRSERNWGVGDFGDLAKFCQCASKTGLAFVGLNPLHATFNRGSDISPYSPVSRVFRNLAYIDVSAVPEFRQCAEARRLVASAGFQEQLRGLRNSTQIEYDRAVSLKLQVMRLLHRCFVRRHRESNSSRAMGYRQYREREGKALIDFATFLAIDGFFLEHSGGTKSWMRWPPAYRQPDSELVASFRLAHAEEIDFHCFVQFELDRQLASIADKARAGGQSIGLYQDLAIGVSVKGSDVWAHPGLFVRGASLGAPPDDYAAQGQDWELPPLNPLQLRADRYGYWIRVLRSAMAHGGSVRIDHVMGLLRQFWIPAGRPASEGAYVRFPWDDLVGILALESTRHKALVIGEDLGTVPTGFSKKLEERDILSTKVFFFERKKNGAFRSVSSYSRRALVTATTHDFGPFLGYLSGKDLELRRNVGLIASDRTLQAALMRRHRDLAAFLRVLEIEGFLSKSGAVLAREELLTAVHSFLRKTPAPLVGLMLDDLAAEIEPVNVPGVGPDRYPSWSRRMKTSLETLCSTLPRGAILS